MMRIRPEPSLQPTTNLTLSQRNLPTQWLGGFAEIYLIVLKDDIFESIKANAADRKNDSTVAAALNI